MMGSHRRQAVVLVLLMGIVAAIAQLAGVGSPQRANSAASATKTLVTVAGGTVPDRSSTSLAKTVTKAREGETVRMSASATMRVTSLRKKRATQVVCGIRYRRDRDAAWSLGTPYETVTLKRVRASGTVRIERSFAAPATDTYRASMACHVVSPAAGAKITATGSMRTRLGLPDGAATPVE